MAISSPSKFGKFWHVDGRPYKVHNADDLMVSKVDNPVDCVKTIGKQCI